VLQRLKQRVAKGYSEANLKKQPQFRVFPEIRKHEAEIVSNRIIA